MEWKDIDSAPKDGTLITLWIEHYNPINGCRWDSKRKCWMEFTLDALESWGWCKVLATPTHWFKMIEPTR